MTTLYNKKETMEYRRNQEDTPCEPFDYFMKNIRKYFPDEFPKKVNNKTRQFEPHSDWRRKKLLFENNTTSDEPKKRFPLWTKKTYSDIPSEEEGNRLMKQLMKKGVFNTNWRKSLKKSLLPDETLTTDDEFKKRVLLLMKKSHQKSMNLDDPSNEEHNRLMREE